MTDVKELEDFIIECIYNYLIEGKINQQTNILKVSRSICAFESLTLWFRSSRSSQETQKNQNLQISRLN